MKRLMLGNVLYEFILNDGAANAQAQVGQPTRYISFTSTNSKTLVNRTREPLPCVMLAPNARSIDSMALYSTSARVSASKIALRVRFCREFISPRAPSAPHSPRPEAARLPAARHGNPAWAEAA